MESGKKQSTHQKVLRDSEQQFRLLVENVRDYAIYMLDLHGKVVSWNAGAQRIKGYSAEEVIGKHFSMFYTQEDIATGLPQYELESAIRKGSYETQGWRVSRDGGQFLANVVLTPIKGDEGELCGFAKITRDITVHQNAEQRFRQVVDSAPSAMVLINTQGVIELVNNQVEQMFGYAREALLGKPVEVLLPRQMREHHPGLRQKFFEKPLARPMGKGRDLFALRKDGSEFPVEIGLNPIETIDGTKVLSAIVDISDRKQKEQKIQAALEEKNVLLSEIHHRVKNNLQIVHSLLDLQSNRISDPVAIEMLKDSQNRIRSMALIHQSLYLSNDFSKVDLGQVLESLIPALMESYSVDQQRIHHELTLHSVQLSINQAIPCGLIINELVSNVLKHAFPLDRQGVIHIGIAYIKKNLVSLSVEDNGIGIAENVVLQNTGTLGMQLVELLTDQLGGELSIKRLDPTRFEIRFWQQA